VVIELTGVADFKKRRYFGLIISSATMKSTFRQSHVDHSVMPVNRPAWRHSVANLASEVGETCFLSEAEIRLGQRLRVTIYAGR
jgi:hypothetical protein